MSKLLKRDIDAATYEGVNGGRDVRWDDAVGGLGLRVYPSGKKSFVLSYRHKGRKRMMTLGRYGAELTLDQARIYASEKLSQLKMQEVDPLEEKRKASRAQTFKELWDDYLKRHAKVRKRSWKEDERRYNLHIPKHWHGRKIADIARTDVRALHDKIGANHPYEANRVLALISIMFTFADRAEITDPGFPNPAKGIEKFKEQKRKRYLKPVELPKLVKAIDTEANIYVRAAIWLYMLTGARKSEILPRRWDDVDFDERRLSLPMTKAGEGQFIPLSSAAIAILKGIPRLEGNPYILPGSKKGHHLVNIGKAWRRIREQAGIIDLRLHDLRRTVGSWLSQSGVDLNTVKEGLRHSNLETTLIYARLTADPARDAFEQHGVDIMKKAGGRLRLVDE